jgi:hypothetical protein
MMRKLLLLMVVAVVATGTVLAMQSREVARYRELGRM